jgi:F0F1-type ATP synthase alpha subunit
MYHLLLSLFLIFSFGCSSSSKKIEDREIVEEEHENLKRDYEVREASSSTRPGWLEDAEVWAKQNNLNIEKYRFFSFETTPKVDRTMACSMARQQAKSQIAGEVTSFIEETLMTYREGEATIDMNNPTNTPLKEFVENSLGEKIAAQLQGVQMAKTYWEKRFYLKDLGAVKDFQGFTCAILLRMEDSQLKNLIQRASEEVQKEANKNSDLKSKVTDALENLEESFSKSRQGLL